MAQVEILVVVGFDHRQQRRNGGLVPKASEGLGTKEFHARIGIGQQRNQQRPRCRKIGVAKYFGGLGDDFRIGIVQESQQRLAVRAILPRQLAHAPNAVNSGQLVARLSDGFGERGGSFGTAFG